MTKNSTKRAISAVLGIVIALQSLGAAAAPVYQYRVPRISASAPYSPETANIVALTSDAEFVVAGEVPQVTLTATVQDTGGTSPPDGQDVLWTSSGGALVLATTQTVQGTATTTLNPPVEVGVVTVRAQVRSSGAARALNIEVLPNTTSAQVANVASSDLTILVGGAHTSVSAAVKDKYGNAVGADISVNWATNSGAVSPSTSKTDNEGTATTLLTSGPTAGVATITAAAADTGDAGRTTAVGISADLSTARVQDVAASPSSLTADGHAVSTLSAAVQDAYGNSVGAGTSVHWTSSLGDIAAASTPTDPSGLARVTLSAPTKAGTSTVSAAVNAEDVPRTATVSFLPDALTARVVALSATPQSVLANGTATTTLKAVVKDANGNALGAGTVVRWTADRGSIASPTSQTDASGEALMTLTSATAAGPANVGASGAAGDLGQSTVVTFAGDPASATIASVSSDATFLAANGAARATLTAAVRDAFGNPVPAGTQVNWTATAGALSSAVSATDATSSASVSLTAGTAATTATVSAKGIASDAGKSRAISFTADAATARVLNVTASPSQIAANGTATSTLAAVVKDVNGNVVGSGVPVTWTASAGTLAAASSSTNASGTASTSLTSSTVAGIAATIVAKGAAGDVGKTAAVSFAADATTAAVTSVSASAPTLAASGSATSVLTAVLKDANGNALGAGVPVAWTTTGGALGASSSNTDSSGSASVTLTSSTVAGTATVTAKGASGDVGKPATVAFIADTATARTATLTASPTTILANGSATSVLTAVLKDANGNALGSGVPVTWSTSAGALSASSSTTDSSGSASVTLTSPTVVSTATVTAKGASGDAGRTSTVAFIADTATARTSTLTASPTTILANGSATSVLTAVLKDANGNALGSGVPVTWSTSAGALSASSSTTNSSGSASVTLTSSTVVSTATVTAKGASGDAGKTAPVAFTADVSTARVTILNTNATSAVANGTPAVTLSATLRDATGNLIPGGTVNWTTTSGTITTTSAAGADGVAYAVLYAGTAAGTATVRAKGVAADAGQTRNISLIADVTTARPVQVVASPSWVCGSFWPGNNITTLYATVRDANGNPVGAGVPVTWAVTRGSIGAGQWGTTYTDATGVAATTLTSSAESQVWAQAYAYGAAGNTYVDVYYEYCKGGTSGGK